MHFLYLFNSLFFTFIIYKNIFKKNIIKNNNIIKNKLLYFFDIKTNNEYYGKIHNITFNIFKKEFNENINTNNYSYSFINNFDYENYLDNINKIKLNNKNPFIIVSNDKVKNHILFYNFFKNINIISIEQLAKYLIHDLENYDLLSLYKYFNKNENINLNSIFKNKEYDININFNGKNYNLNKDDHIENEDEDEDKDKNEDLNEDQNENDENQKDKNENIINEKYKDNNDSIYLDLSDKVYMINYIYEQLCLTLSNRVIIDDYNINFNNIHSSKLSLNIYKRCKYSFTIYENQYLNIKRKCNDDNNFDFCDLADFDIDKTSNNSYNENFINNYVTKKLLLNPDIVYDYLKYNYEIILEKNY